MARKKVATKAAYRQYAQENLHRDGEQEFDESAKVSMGDDDGAYVQAWIWVPRSSLGSEYQS
jgi:hypothetical protein